MDTKINHYPDFDYPATQLSAFAYSVGTFIISLKSGGIVRFDPKDVEHFRSWLINSKVRDISVDKGPPEKTPVQLPRRKSKWI